MTGIIQNEEVRELDAEVFVKMREVGANLDDEEVDEGEYLEAKSDYSEAREAIENESWNEAKGHLKNARKVFNRMMKNLHGTTSLNKLYNV